MNSIRSAAARTSLCLVALLLSFGLGPRVLAQTLDTAAVDAAVQRFMTDSGAPGVAIGMVTPSGVRVVCRGVASSETGAPVDERTLFELGSVSKTFAITLAAAAVEAGAMQWNDPVSRIVPELQGSRLDDVSLLNLATHTTGGMPLQLPDAVTTPSALMAYYRQWTPPSPPGTIRTYANPSIGLLGIATARALHGSFATLVHDRIIEPLGLSHTVLDVSAEEMPHYAQGYTRDGRPIRLKGDLLATEAYGIRTTVGDLSRFVQAQLGLIEIGPDLRRAIDATHVGHFQAGPMTQALIWEWYPLPVSATDLQAGNGNAMALDPTPVTRLTPPRPPPGEALINKTGATNGFGSYIASSRAVGSASRSWPTATTRPS